MKIVLSMRIVSNGQTKATISREIQSSMIPFPGLIIEDDHESEIKGVVFNVEEDYYFVTLSPDNLESKTEVDSVKEMYKERGWTIVGEGN